MADAPMGIALQQIRRLFDEGTLTGLSDSQLLERFLARRDEAAFAALVRRHGPMVLGTCRAVLRDPNDAEDAFQATFLVLVGKARSIRGGDALGTWLHRVAHRIALQAGAEAARRRTCERLAVDLRNGDRPRDELGEDTRQVLHEELARLSEKYRLPLLKCDLEGKSYAQAAMELKWGEATVRRRLAGARELLRSRLVRRGVMLATGGVVTSLGRSAGAAVPAPWIETTVKAAGAFTSRAARIAIGEIGSTTAADLARKSLRAMLLSQLRSGAAAAFFLISLVGLAWGLGTYGQDEPASSADPQMKRPQAVVAPPAARAKTEKAADPQQTATPRGRVLDADGRPFPGAALYLNSRGLQHPYHSPVRATSGPDGRFRFSVPKSDFDLSYGDAPWIGAPVLARASGYAFGLANYRNDAEELTVQLARDDVPITGHVIDLEGHPVAGVKLTVLGINAPAQGTLEGFLKALEDRKELYDLEHEFLPIGLWTDTDPPLIPPVTTGTDGRFLISGIGRERVATLEIRGSTIETVQVVVRTRPGATIRVPGYKDGPPAEGLNTIYGATFEHVAGPTRPIEGVVRDLDSKAPLAGIMVHGEQSMGNPVRYVQAVTDAQGHYRLVGLPRGREGYLLVLPPVDFPLAGKREATVKVLRDEDLPYVRARAKVPSSSGPGPIKLDINLKRGVWVTGRVIDEDSQKPVRANVEYFVFADNPHLESYPDSRGPVFHPHFARQDGAFTFVALPGPGLLAARATKDEYRQGVGVETVQHKPKNGLLETHPYYAAPTNYHAVAELDPAPGTESMNRDLLLKRGRSLTVTVLGPDGKPLAGNQVAGLRDMGYWETPSPEASTYTILSLNPGKGRTLTFLNWKKGLAGELPLRGDEIQPPTITLKPWGVLTGRIVDADGQPRNADDQLSGIHLPGGYPKIGKDGRFRVEGLIPGKSYTLQLLEKGYMLGNLVVKDVKVGSGEVKDLGDVVPQPPKSQ